MTRPQSKLELGNLRELESLSESSFHGFRAVFLRVRSAIHQVSVKKNGDGNSGMDNVKSFS